MRDLVIVQPGQKLESLISQPGDFTDWILGGMGLPLEAARVVRLDLGDALPAVEEVRAVVVTGASAMVTEPHSWIEPSCAWLRQVAKACRPILGICFGHQLLAQAFGGLVDFNPLGVEVGTTRLRLTQAGQQDELLAPLVVNPWVHVSHWQSVHRLPLGAELLASSPVDPNHAFRIGDRIWGLQFHPEFSTPVIHGYRDFHLSSGGETVARSPGVTQVADLSTGPAILRRFYTLTRRLDG